MEQTGHDTAGTAPRATAADGHTHHLEPSEDLTGLVGRRRALGLLGVGVLALVGCGGGSSSGDDAGASSTTSTTSGTAPADGGREIPDETAGPFPANGSNGPDILAEPGVVRRDIRSSFGASTTTAVGVPITYELTVTEAGTGEPLAGTAVYVWHCDREGRYSMYSPGVEGENYLRGVQEADADGHVTFTSIFPGAYDGRWPHVHFEVYPSLDAATTASDLIKTSQMALPEDTSTDVYATEGYEQSAINLGETSLASDLVFEDDGAEDQLATVSGSVDAGYIAALAVPL